MKTLLDAALVVKAMNAILDELVSRDLIWDDEGLKREIKQEVFARLMQEGR